MKEKKDLDEKLARRREQLRKSQAKYVELHSKHMNKKKLQCYLAENILDDIQKIKKDNGFKNISQTIQFLTIEFKINELDKE